MGDDYLEYLSELDKKLKFVGSDPVAKTSQSKRDLEPALERLRIKVWMGVIGCGDELY